MPQLRCTIGVSETLPRDVVSMPRSGTARTPVIFVTREFGSGIFGPGMGEIAYGLCAASSCLKLNVSKRVNIVFRVPPDGFALVND
jgi:hypothetical protein